MKRRHFVAGAAAAPLAGSLQAQQAQPSVIEIRYYRMRNGADAQRQRLTEMIAKHYLPAHTRAGGGPCGAFTVSVGVETPQLIIVAGFKSLADMEQVKARMQADAAFWKTAENFYSQPGLPYVRSESQVLRAFGGFPSIEAPQTADGRAPRLFELRTYESNTPFTLRKKIKMFEDGEIDIFRKHGLQPVFFGQTIVGRSMPNLTYMVCFDDLASREKNWRAFATSPEWKKLSATPGLSDAEVVSNISNTLLSPIGGSPIR